MTLTINQYKVLFILILFTISSSSLINISINILFVINAAMIIWIILSKFTILSYLGLVLILLSNTNMSSFCLLIFFIYFFLDVVCNTLIFYSLMLLDEKFQKIAGMNARSSQYRQRTNTELSAASVFPILENGEIVIMNPRLVIFKNYY